MSTSLGTPLRSKRFGKYWLLTELGRGGMATVYLAVAHAGIQDVRKLVVIKLLNDNLRADAEFVEMFAREARIAAELAHPNIVVTHTVGQEDGRYYIAMEYLEGVTLREIMRYSADWPLQDRLPLFGALCLALTGLSYVHDFHDHNGQHLGLIHRDIKPDNIFITTTGQVKLLDFGVAKANWTGIEATPGIAVRGTVQYLPPEAVRQDAEVDMRWDLFSAGVIVAELATGNRFWDGLPPTQILTRLATDEIPTPTLSADEEVPPPLARLLERALQPDPLARYQSANELRRAILSFLTRQNYRVSSADLGRIVGHLFDPIRQQREDVIKAGMEEMDRSRPPSGTWSMASASSSDHVMIPTPPGPVRMEETGPAVSITEPPAPTPSRPSKLWWAAAALLLVAIPGAWMLARQGNDGATVDERRTPTTPVAPAASDPVRKTLPPTAAPTPVPVPEPPKPAPVIEPEAPTVAPDVPEPAPTSESASSPTRSSSSRAKSSKARKKERSTSPPPPDSAEPKPPPPTKKLDLEPSPYTR